jgi:hypothetical protein
MPQRQSANADGEDGRDDARPVAKLCNGDGKVIVQESLRRIVGYVTRALSTERAGVESDADPRRWQYLKTTRATGRRLGAGAWRLGTPGTAGSAETERRERMCSAHGGIHAGAAKVIADIARYAFGKG